jgi:hypothetical protein
MSKFLVLTALTQAFVEASASVKSIDRSSAASAIWQPLQAGPGPIFALAKRLVLGRQSIRIHNPGIGHPASPGRATSMIPCSVALRLVFEVKSCAFVRAISRADIAS